MRAYPTFVTHVAGQHGGDDDQGGRLMTEPKRRARSRSPAFTALLTARALSVVGDGIGTVALVVYVVHTRGSGAGVGLLLLVVALPSFLSPLTGVVADR